MKKQIKEIYQMIRGNLRSLLLFEFFFRFIAGTLLVQVGTRGLKFCLDRAGYSYLTLANGWKFFLHPWTILFVLVMLVLVLLLNMTEIGGLITVFSGAAYSWRPALWEIFYGAFVKVKDELTHKNYRLFGMGLISSLMLNLFYLYRMFSRIKPVNFVMKELFDQPLAVSVLMLVFLLFLVLLFPAVFVFHGCMIGQKSYWDSRFESMELLKGRWAKTIGSAGTSFFCGLLPVRAVHGGDYRSVCQRKSGTGVFDGNYRSGGMVSDGCSVGICHHGLLGFCDGGILPEYGTAEGNCRRLGICDDRKKLPLFQADGNGTAGGVSGHVCIFPV